MAQLSVILPWLIPALVQAAQLTPAAGSLGAAAGRAAVFAEPAQGPGKGEVGAELLRFVTAYKRGLEAIVDITPFSPLLQAAANGSDFIQFYGFVDTWVGNGSSVDLYLNNVTGKCYPVSHSQGNGWSLSADVLLWGPGDRPDTRPKQSVMLASGYFGARYPLGDVQVHEGVVANDATIRLDAPMAADLSAFAAPPPVYVCPEGSNGIYRAALLGFAATEIVHFETYLSRLSAPQKLKHVARANLARSLVEMLVKPHLVTIAVEGPHENFTRNSTGNYSRNMTVIAKYNPDKVRAQPGMLIFYDSGVSTDHFDRRARRWTNQSYPFEAVGVVASVAGDRMVVHLTHPCLPSNITGELPRFSVPAGPSIISEAEALVGSAFRRGRKLVAMAASAASENKTLETLASGTDGYAARPPGPQEFWEPLLLEPKTGWARWKAATESLSETGAGVGTPTAREEELLGQPAMIGRLSAQARPAGFQPGSSLELLVEPVSEVQLSDFIHERACMVSQQRDGNLFTRQFEVGTLVSGDKVLLHLVVTGHGWAATTDQCGEYCHAIYHLALNGQSAANVSQFRNDCPSNPIGAQYGTWEEKRNGWCPGTVEHGVYFDVTNLVKAGANSLNFSVSVWSHERQRYQPYTNYAGFVFGDEASLSVDLSLLVYGSDTVSAVMLQGRPYTPAEVALVYGSNAFEALAPVRPEPLQLADLAALLEPPRPHQRRAEVTGVPESQQAGDRPLSFLEEGARGRLMRSEVGGRQERDQVNTARAQPFDLMARAPWYLYNASREGAPDRVLGARRVPVFSAALVQAESRTVRVAVPAINFTNFTQAALHFRLTKPDGLELDDWDRQGSFGLVLSKGGQEAQVHVVDAPAQQSRVDVTLPRRPLPGIVPGPKPALLQAGHT